MGLLDRLRKGNIIKDVTEAYKEAEYEERHPQATRRESRPDKREVEAPIEEIIQEERQSYVPLVKKGILKSAAIDPNMRQPLLILIHENMTATIKEDAHTGENEVKFPNGQTGFIVLDAQKLVSIPWGNTQMQCWVHYVRETTSYPTEPQHDSETIGGIMQTIIVSNEKYRNKTMEGWIKLAWMVGIVVVVLVVVYAMFLLPAQTQANLAMMGKDVVNATNTTLPPEVIR